MVDFQIKQDKIAFVDSNDNTIYTLPDSAGTSGNALVTDGTGKLFFGGIDIDSVLAAGDSSNRDMTVTVINAKTIEANTVVEGGALLNFQGVFSGYTAGGQQPPNPVFPSPYSATEGINGGRTIDKFPFASDANATDAGFLDKASQRSSGQSSADHGYSCGGNQYSGIIHKFPFSNNAESTEVGSLAGTGRMGPMGHSSNDTGYSSGGAALPSTPVSRTTIAKFPFAHDVNSAVHGGLTVARQRGAGHSASTHGYSAGGLGSPDFTTGRKDVIDKFPFSITSSGTTDVGDLTISKTHLAGQSSTTHGYVSGGNDAPSYDTTITTIEKYPFASDTGAIEIGDLSVSRAFSAGQSAISHGYTSGGYVSDADFFTNVIDKFPFSSDGTATDVGDISKVRAECTGHQT